MESGACSLANMVTKSKTGKGTPGMSEKIFDEYASDYSNSVNAALEVYGVKQDFFTRQKSFLFNHLLKQAGLEPSEVDLVDVGCGTAQIHSLIGGSLGSVVGVDVSEESLKEARSQFPQNKYVHYDGSVLPLETASADAAIAICVFHHVPPENWQQLANEMMRILRPEGMALIIEHNPWNPITRRIVSSCPIDDDAVLLNRRETAALLEKSGGVKIESKSILTIPPIGRVLSHMDLLLGSLPFGAQYYTLARKPGL